MFGGDLNTDLRCNSVATNAILGLARQLDLVVCSDVTKPINNIDYTFHNHSLGHRSWLDWMLVSSSLKSAAIEFNIIETALNLSDHLPISIKLSLLFVSMTDCTKPENENNCKRYSKPRWDKLF